MKILMTGFALALAALAAAGTALPPGQTLNDAAFGDAAFVSVGANGTIYSSINSGPWELRSSGTTNNLQAVAHGGGLFVAAGANGTLLSSSNGVDWVVRSTGGAWSNPDIAYGNGMFVVGTKGLGSVWTMLASTNGADWTRVDVEAAVPTGALPPAVAGPLPFGGIAFGEGRFLAIGGRQAANLVLTSTDGVTWREQGANIPRATSAMQGPITYGDGKFAIVVNITSSDDDDDGPSYIDQVLLSSDGVNWQGATFGGVDVPAIAAADCTLVGATSYPSNPIWYTHGDYWWTNLVMPEAMSVKAIAYGNGKFVAFGSHIMDIPVPPLDTLFLSPASQQSTTGGYAYFWFNPPICFEEPIYYQWRHNDAPIVGQTNASMQLSLLTTNDAGAYTVVARNGAGLSVTSTVSTLTVVHYPDPDPYPPQISSPTTNSIEAMAFGSQHSISAILDGWPSPALQWRLNGIDIPGATNSYLSFYNVDSRAIGDYTLVASNYLGSLTSSVITVTLSNAAPALGSGTVTLNVLEGETARFYLPGTTLLGAPQGDLYIFRNGTNTLLPLSYYSRFSLRDVSLADAGAYSIVASNALGVSEGLVATLNVTPAGRLDHWTRRNPLPQNDPLLEVAYGNGRFVAVGENDTVVVSTNATDWFVHRLKSELTIRAIAFGNGIFVAVGDAAILTSTDGVTWATRVNRFYPVFEALIFANGRFVAAAGDEVLTSTDGVRWQDATLPLNIPRRIRAIAFGNGIFVAIPQPYYESPILISSDGLNWSPAGYGLSDSEQIEDVAFGNGLFVAVGDEGAIYTSADGLSWTARDSEVSNRLIDVTFGNARFVAVGTRGRIISSGNGTNWRRETSGTPDRLEGVTFADGLFVAVGENGTILSSPNSSTWTKRSQGVTRDLDGMAIGNGTIVVVGKGGSIITSTDGTNYVQRVSGTLNDLHGVGWADNLFVAVGEPETILTSPDAAQWTVRHLGTNSALKSVAKGDGTWVAVGTGGAVLTSADAASWVRRESYTLNDLNSVAYGNGTFVVVGDNLSPNGTLLTSPDGITWTRRNQYIGKNLRAVTFANGTFVAAANDGVLLSSSDGQTWSALPNFSYTNLRAITYDRGVWVIVGNYGLVLTSVNLSNWLVRTPQGSDNLHGVVPLNGKFVAIGNRGTILQSDFYSQMGPTLFARVVAGGVELSVTGEAGTSFAIEAKNSLTFNPLTGGAWSHIGGYTFAPGVTNVTIVDPPQNSSTRFYRAVAR